MFLGCDDVVRSRFFGYRTISVLSLVKPCRVQASLDSHSSAIIQSFLSLLRLKSQFKFYGSGIFRMFRFERVDPVEHQRFSLNLFSLIV